MPGYPEAKHAFAVNPSEPVVPYSGVQVFGFFAVALFPALSLTACGLRVYSRRLSQGLGLGEQGRFLAAAVMGLLIRHADDWLMFLAAVCLQVGHCTVSGLLAKASTTRR
jgi:hypothetical protein